MILSPFYWQFYFHSTDHSTLNLLIISASTEYSTTIQTLHCMLRHVVADDSTPILLTIYWWLYSHSTNHISILLVILLPFNVLYTYSTPILLMILSPFYWSFYSFCLSFCSHSTEHSSILLEILLLFFWWLYSHSARILLSILLPFYGPFSAINKTHAPTGCLSRKLWC